MEAQALAAPQAASPYPAYMTLAYSREKYSASYTNGKDPDNYSASVTYERTEISIEFSTYSLDEIKKNAEKADKKIEPKDSSIAETAQLKAQIHDEVLKQVKGFLGNFFEENPEAVEQVSRGEIPEYFNVENTARRILDIYFNYYQEGDDKEAFVERAKGIIEQAYGEVAGLVGELPGIVLDTKQKVMEILDAFANGENISGFMGREIA